jgi:site-specific recombinase XerD
VAMRKIDREFQICELSDEQRKTLIDYYTARKRGQKMNFSNNKYIQNRLSPKATSFVSFYTYIRTLREFGEFIKIPYESATREHVDEYITELERRKVKPATMGLYTLIIKLFYIWLHKSEEIPHLVSHIERIRIPLKVSNPRDVLIPNEIKEMTVAAGDNLRDRAIPGPLFESHARAGEFVGLRIKDFVRKENYAILCLNGKTGKRNVAISDSVPLIEAYIDSHPFKNDPDAPLFLSQSDNNKRNKLTVRGLQEILAKLGRITKIKKKVNPHWFRHSGLDNITRRYNFNERDLRIRAGWSKNSRMPQVYLHYQEDVSTMHVPIAHPHAFSIKGDKVAEYNPGFGTSK